MTIEALNTRTAIDGKVYILTIEQTARGELAEYVQTLDDTAGDFGDVFDSTQRAMLATGLSVTVTDERGTKRMHRDMVAATRKAS